MQTNISTVRYDERLKYQAYAWMRDYNPHLTHACTFTFHQNAELTAERAWQQWECFCKYLNRYIYKHAAKRNKKSLLILPVLHGQISGKRLHFHAAIGCIDRNYSYEKLTAIINKCWRKMSWTQHEADIKSIYYADGWISYMLHESVRLDLDSVDLTRCYIPAALMQKY